MTGVILPCLRAYHIDTIRLKIQRHTAPELQVATAEVQRRG